MYADITKELQRLFPSDRMQRIIDRLGLVGTEEDWEYLGDLISAIFTRGLLGAAVVVGLLALLTLTATLILALATVLAGWLAALIVTAVYGAAAAALGLLGKARRAKATPLAPTQAIDSVKEDVSWLKT